MCSPASLFFPKQFTVSGSQCFKEWSPWCWMVWSGSRPACLPLPFICLPVLFICLPVLFICFLPGWVLVVGFPALLSFVSQFFSLVSQFFHLSPRLGACGRVHLSPTSFHLPLRLGACGGVRFPAGLSPTSFHSRRLCSGSRPACLPLP